MKLSYRTLSKLAAVAVVLSFGARAYAENARDEVVHAYHLLKTADRDYDGHRAEAVKDVETAGNRLGLSLDKFEFPRVESQWKSDQKLSEARRLLKDAGDKLEERDRDRAAESVNRAVHEIDRALETR
jgi:hypothetical protein